MEAGEYTRDRGNPDLPRPTLTGVAQNWKTPAARDPGIMTERLRTATGEQWSGGERAFDAETGRMAQTGLTQQLEQWRTPSDLSKRGGSQPAEKRKAGGHSVNLEDQAEHWLTPNVPNGGRTTHHATMQGRTAMHNGKKVQVGLESQAAAWSTPTARMHKGGSLTSLTRKDGKSRLDMLDWQAEAWADSRSSSQDLPTPDGPDCCAPDPNSRPPSTKKRLNVFFVEALMRWPTGWTDCGLPETALTRWLPHMRGFVWMLCSQRMEPPAQASLFE